MFAMSAHADTETVNWYKDGQTYAQTTCTVGGDIILPETPTKRGYNFTGWAVALYDLSTLDYTINGDVQKYNAMAKSWATVFSYGTVSGKAICSVTSGTFAVAGTPYESNTSGQYCWCRAVEFTPSDTGIPGKPVTMLSWVFLGNYNTMSNCEGTCVYLCPDRVQNNLNFRKAIFGIQ